ncbi:MAG: archease [Candidatus Nanohaloarchaea archaeon]
MSYEVLSHTADAKFSATGDSLEAAFSEATKAFAEIVGSDPKAGEIRHSFRIESENTEALLFDFLDKLVYIQDTEDVAATHLKSIEIEETEKGYRLDATVWTDPIEPSMSLLDIKAPTYNEMKVDYEKGEGWKLEAVLDI